MSKATRRPRIPLKDQLAAALATMLVVNGDGKLEPAIPYEDRKRLTADDILSLFHFDHDPVARALGGSDEHYNLTPRFIREHRVKTAKVDIPVIRKTDRIKAAHDAFLAGRGRLPASPDGAEEGDTHPRPRKSKLPASRPMPGTKASGWKKPMRGPGRRREVTR